MTALAALLRSSLENPTTPISGASFGDLWGQRSTSGVAVTESRVYGLSAWLRGVTLTSGTMAGLPLKVYRHSDKTRVRVRTVLDNPNRRQTPFEFWQTVHANAINWGTGYALKKRDGSGTVREAWSIHPSRVEVAEVGPSDQYPDGLRFRVTNANGSQAVASSWEIARFPYLSPYGTVGLSAIAAGRQSLGIAIAAEDVSATFYAEGALINGVLSSKQTLDQDQADRLRARWKAKVGSGSHDIAILDSDTSFQAVAMRPADAEFLESRKYGIAECARFLGMPPELLGGSSGDSLTYKTIDGLTLGWQKFGLKSPASMFEQRVTREFLPGGWDSGSWFAEYDFEGLLRGDPASRAMFHHYAINDGWETRAEVRQFENLDPAPPEAGLDQFIEPKGIIASDGSLGTQGAK